MASIHVAEQLAETELFGVLDRATLENIAKRSVERSYRRGQIIFSQGENPGSLYVLTQGRVKVVLLAQTGDEMLLRTMTPPATFGELALVDGGARSASVEAVEPSRALMVPRSLWDELVAREPAIKDGLIRSMAAVLRRITDQASDFVFLDLAGRVAKLLIREYEAGGDTRLDLPLSQSDIAQMVGASRQSVNQILGHLVSRGYVEMQGRTIVLKDIAALQRRAGLGS